MNSVLTIFTPTYNRAHLLPDLFRSIVGEVRGVGAVEWLIVDDGSEDQTSILLEKFSREAPGLIRAIRVKNGGKHRAINLAISEAHSPWVMILDSDDLLRSGVLNEILTTLERINLCEDIGMVRALRSFPEKKSQPVFDLEVNPCFHSHWVNRQRGFDSVEVLRKSFAEKHRFPEIDGEKFMAESWLWFRMGKHKRTLFVNDVWIECRYQDNGLSRNNNALRIASPVGALNVYGEICDSNVRYSMMFRASVNWWRYYFHARFSQRNIYGARKASILFAIPGFLVFLREFARMKAKAPARASR